MKSTESAEGRHMERDDCAFPLLDSMVATAVPKVAFKDADVALLVGARPRAPEWRARTSSSDGRSSTSGPGAFGCVEPRRHSSVVGNPPLRIG